MKVFTVNKIEFYPDYKRPDVSGEVAGVFKEQGAAHKKASEILIESLTERAEWDEELEEPMSSLDKSGDPEKLFKELIELNDSHGGDEESGWCPYVQVFVDESALS